MSSGFGLVVRRLVKGETGLVVLTFPCAPNCDRALVRLATFFFEKKTFFCNRPVRLHVFPRISRAEGGPTQSTPWLIRAARTYTFTVQTTQLPIDLKEILEAATTPHELMSSAPRRVTLEATVALRQVHLWSVAYKIALHRARESEYKLYQVSPPTRPSSAFLFLLCTLCCVFLCLCCWFL